MKPTGWSEGRGAWGATFGHASVRRMVGGEPIDEPSAALCFTACGGDCPVLHQAYQLLGFEMAELLGARTGWTTLEHGRLDGDDVVDKVAIRAVLARLDREAQDHQ